MSCKTSPLIKSKLFMENQYETELKCVLSLLHLPTAISPDKFL